MSFVNFDFVKNDIVINHNKLVFLMANNFGISLRDNTVFNMDIPRDKRSAILSDKSAGFEYDRRLNK